MTSFVARLVEFQINHEQFGVAGLRRTNPGQALAHGWLPGALAPVAISLPLTYEEVTDILTILQRAAGRVVTGLTAGQDDGWEEGP